MEEVTDSVGITWKYMRVEDKIQLEWGIGVVQNTGVPLFCFEIWDVTLIDRIDDIDKGVHGYRNRAICHNCDLCLEVILVQGYFKAYFRVQLLEYFCVILCLLQILF